jgi:uncharacterized protein YbgA (DUF1722 family)/uncharacterized protein YbbK (DUF523 family)
LLVSVSNSLENSLQSLPTVAIGSCLVGEAVRFNGAAKKRNFHIDSFSEHFNFIHICPEVGIGMGVPREPIRLLDDSGKRLAVGSIHSIDTDNLADFAPALRDYAQTQLQQHKNLCGYILVKGSPSCGLEKVKRYNRKGNVLGHDAMGVYAQQIAEIHPLLPLEDDGRLRDVGLRESFVSRVYLLHRWQQLAAEKYSINDLIRFYSHYKYKVMAHSVPVYQQIGKLLAQPKLFTVEKLAQQLITLMLQALKKPATRASHTNALQHVQGYLKKQLSTKDKEELTRVIDQYHQGFVPLITAITLLQHHFSNSPNDYIDDQVFMSPYPESLALRSHLQ